MGEACEASAQLTQPPNHTETRAHAPPLLPLEVGASYLQFNHSLVHTNGYPPRLRSTTLLTNHIMNVTF